MSLDSLPPVSAVSIFSLPLGVRRLKAWFSKVISKGPAGKFKANSDGEFSPEPPVRIELTTFRLQGGCSTTELGRRSDNYGRRLEF
jgi:hypothetical protein